MLFSFLVKLKENLKKEIKMRDKILILLCSVIVLSLGALIFILPQESFSERENRYLNTLRAPAPTSLLDGSYAKELSAFYSDQFPYREYATSLYSLCESALGKREINQVIRYKSHLISRYGEKNKQTEFGLPRILVKSKFELFKENSEELNFYYRTDHHRTTEGAYYLYLEACELLKITPYPENYFTRESVCSNFYGTAFRRSCLPISAVTPDEIELYRYEGDCEVRVTVNDKKESFYGFYDFSKLNCADKYAIFLSGNYASVSVFSGKDKPRLLLIKDSFANAVVPFLALHYNLDLIDPRYATPKQLSDALNDSSYDAKLVLACKE